MNLKVLAHGLASVVVRRYCGPFWVRRRQLARTQWFDPQELKKLQLGLSRRLLRHCYTTVPYYRRQMEESGIRIHAIESLEDVGMFPLLTKQHILEAGSDLVSSKYPRWLRHTAYTGGTTGTPLALERDVFSTGNEHAFVRRQYDWAGIGLGDRCAFLTGRLVAQPDQMDGLCAYDPFMEELILSTYHLSHRTAGQYARIMQEYRVKALVGYPSAAYLLAQVCQDEGCRLSLAAVLTSSEVLTDSMRRTIEAAFGCRVFDFYGSAERVCYIHTCEAGCYHVVPEYGLTELIPIDNQTPTRCRIVSTGFWNAAMPLVRYDLSDIAIPAYRPCSCGRAFPVVERILGREGDQIVTASGRQLSAALLTHLLYGTGNILESQIIQDAVDHIRIEYVPRHGFSREDLQAFEDLVHRHLPSELHVDFTAVDAVQRTESGKIQPVVSLLK